ncbi:rhodanese-like domain-containing protein 8, chloroplastic isoform X2 [Asparagus officinalis]|uniref:rhodanese-like domain-containing protein 8, chloroplastic isoform X2 n=1 Tax=Asparagus officinalis TaxID=4686 RepID=UPI00098E6EBE|nr:rhodanese-like domain-containing protein 8, chloroplastic isoform X2 [Asparagus officinalis]
MHLSSVMAMRATSCGGNVHRGAFLFAAPPPISTHRQNKKGAFFAPKNLSLFPSLNWEKRRSRIIGCCPRVHRVEGEAIEELEEFLVVSFYKFVLIKDPEAEVSKHQAFLEERDIHGRIYVNEQGINAQYSGPRKDALAYAKWLKDDHKFTDILVQTSPSLNGHAFPRLKLRLREVRYTFLCWILQCEPPHCLRQNGEKDWKLQMKMTCNQRRRILFTIGSFCFLTLEMAMNGILVILKELIDLMWTALENQVSDSDPLAGIDKENTDILMYCTGGIRCDVYSTILRQRGFQNLYTLSGGVSNYLQSEGSDKWIGNLFVFDSRLSLPPSTYKSEENEEKGLEIGYQNEQILEMVYHNSTFARCYICSSRLVEFRHRNCANLDCNRLFLCCTNCVQELRGCCCSDCTNSSRLRPVLQGSQRYQKWHVYRDEVFRQ